MMAVDVAMVMAVTRAVPVAVALDLAVNYGAVCHRLGIWLWLWLRLRFWLRLCVLL